jgi:formyltetrahydrofolate deformylase
MSLPACEPAILLFSCPDARGIVAEVSHFIFTYNGNVINSDQHRDPESNTFFMRVEWDISQFSLPRDKIIPAFEPIAIKYGMDWRIEYPHNRKRMAIMVSQYDHCLYDLILRNKEGETHADIRLVVSNHDSLRGVAEYFGVPFIHTPMTKELRPQVEQEQLRILADHQIDFVVLARYMQILSPAFIRAYPNRIINIHHSFLPAFIGAKPYHQAYERGVKIIGATSHYVTEELDQGPIIEQDTVRISHRDDVQDLVRKGRNLEKTVLSQAVKLHLEHRVLPFGNKTIIFD